MESEDSGGEWRRSGRKRCRPKNSDTSSDVPQQPKKQNNTSLIVIFVPVKEETRLTALNHLKVSEALEKLCQECIIQVRPNDRLNLIAVDVRNGQAAKTLLNTAMLCAVPTVGIQKIPSTRSCCALPMKNPEERFFRVTPKQDLYSQHEMKPERRNAWPLIQAAPPGPVCSSSGRGRGCGQEGFFCHVTSSMGTRKYLASLPNGGEIRIASSTKA
ncbi:hypothetical protein HPB47_017247 [Ixodes persulcatus]|uniref:Uncharacterized protein n=1 Tax=Ixodes persulcatus TaxID=34615 RepID=A0AC60QNS5_IXOPE|nr:hypothetical protein HPB47_017247 [Ixodes persulcatus]